MYKHNPIHIYTEHITLDIHAYTYTNKYDMGTFIHTLNKYTYAQIFMQTMIHINTNTDNVDIQILNTYTQYTCTYTQCGHIHIHTEHTRFHIYWHMDTYLHTVRPSHIHWNTLIHGYTCTYITHWTHTRLPITWIYILSHTELMDTQTHSTLAATPGRYSSYIWSWSQLGHEDLGYPSHEDCSLGSLL